MKISKKFAWVLALFAILCAPFVLSHHKAYAADINDLSQICVPKYSNSSTESGRHVIDGWLSVSFTDRADMTATYSANGNCASPAGNDSGTFFGNVTFDQIFQNISGQSGVMLLNDSAGDSNVSYGEAVGGSGQDDTRIDQFASNLDNLMQDPLGGHDAIVSTSDLSNALSKAEITIGFETDKVGYGCDSSVSNENFVLVDGNPPEWKCNDSGNIAGDKGLIIGAGNFTNLANFNISYTVTTTTDSSGNPMIESVYPNEQGDRTFSYCTDRSEYVSQSCQGNLTLDASLSDINNLGTGTKQFNIKNQSGTSVAVIVAGSGAQASQQNPGGGPAGTASDDLCATASNSPLSWLGCPVLNAAQDALVGKDGQSGLVGIFDDQLSFRVSDLDGNNGQESVQKIWALIRDLSSAVIVIILLIMIISQAIGGGPFDAYTVRKLLPKLVAAVILMQLSWAITSWVVNTVDDLGRGLADIMYFPFGGTANMGLGVLLGHAGVGSGAAGHGADASLIFVNWVVLLAGGILLVAALPVVLVFGFTAVMALFAVIATLIFRKILIIACLIFSPLAIAAWILPGTQSYYKLWKDNFLKALMMFPLAIAIIATGRIFAYIVGTQKNGIFLNVIFILIGYFGVLFILPKTFKWGGTIMTAGSNTINGLVTKASAGAKEPIKGYGQRWQGERAKRYNPQAKWGTRAVRRIQSGHILPTERSRRLTIASGDKWAQERNDEATAYVTRTQEKALSGYDYYDMDADGKFLNLRKNAAGQYLDSTGNIVKKNKAQVLYAGTDKSKASFERLTGVAAGKQALIDISGNDGTSVTDQRAAQAAQKLLIDTHSEIELQSAQIQGGKHQGKRANEVKSWKTNITSSPPHYSAINGSRPDLAPDLIESAEGAASRRLGRQVTYDKSSAADRRQIDVEKARIAIERLTPEQAAQVHYGFYDDVGKIGGEAAVDGKGNAILDPTTGLPMNISQLLANRLKDFKASPGPVGANAVGSLVGGKQEHVDAALAAAGTNLDTIIR